MSGDGLAEEDGIFKNEFLEDDERNDDADADENDENENLFDCGRVGAERLRWRTGMAPDGEDDSRRSTSTKNDFELGDDENGSRSSGASCGSAVTRARYSRLRGYHIPHVHATHIYDHGDDNQTIHRTDA